MRKRRRPIRRAALAFARQRHGPLARWEIALATLWSLAWLDWAAWHLAGSMLQGAVFLAGAAAAGWRVRAGRAAAPPVRRIVGSLALPFILQAAVFCAAMAGPRLAHMAAWVSLAILFTVGLGWTVRGVELASRRLAVLRPSPASRIWNPLDLRAWFYRARFQRLDQSAATFVSYTCAFVLTGAILGRLSGCRDVYDLPAGGGEVKRSPQVVELRKIIRKKFVINPLSAVLFNPPPIDDVPLELDELTEHHYQIGQGEAGAAGFVGGTRMGKVRFIRLQYEGGDWDQDFGIGADLNILLEYGIRTGHPVHDRTESRKISQLANFPARNSPPLVYMTGQRHLLVSDAEADVLSEYLTDKHGMIFADNGGSSGWHAQFFDLMQRVLPTVRPVRVPLDHPIHRLPYPIPFLPYVAPHGGKDAWGWVVDGRLAVYYHPGDIGDAWADGHAGVKRPIWEACYQLGTNVILYAHANYSRWLESLPPAENEP